MPPAKKPKPPKLSAFISHAKADAKKAQEIAASLEERGLQCWIAPRDVKAGRAYGDE
ncbi:MAG: TIR domain-containing protein, partial [Methyloceanibacter sp.]